MKQIFNEVTYYKNSKGYFTTPFHKYGRTRRMHRDVWEFYNGPIPEGYVVHHKDFDKNNNCIDNLELLTPDQHNSLYHPPKKAEPTLPSFTKWKCLACGKTEWLQTRYAQYKKFCSNTCGMRYYRATIPNFNKRYRIPISKKCIFDPENSPPIPPE